MKKILILGLLAVLLVAGCTQKTEPKIDGSSCCDIPEREIIILEPQEYNEFYVICHNTSDFTISFQYKANIMFFGSDLKKHEGEKVKFYPYIRWVAIHDDFDRDIEIQHLIHCKADFGIPIKITNFYGGVEIWNKTETMFFRIEDNYNLHSFHEKITQEIRKRFEIW